MDYLAYGIVGIIGYSIACFIAGIFDAICGGGGLVTLPMLMAIGMPIHSVAPTNQCSMTLGSAVSFARFWKNGKIYWKAAAIATPTAIVGAFFGAKINQVMPDEMLRMIMLVLIPIIAVVVLLKKDVGEENKSDTLSSGKMAVLALAIGLIVGAYQGFYGAGSGTFFLLAFAILIRLDLVTASGCTKVVLMCAIITGAITYARAGLVFWPYVIFGSAFNIVGSYVGAGLALTKGAKLIRPMFFVVVGLLIIKLVMELLG